MTATKALHALIRRDIESGSKRYAESYGFDWFNLTPEESAVFGLSLDDLPSLVAVWMAFEEVLDVCHMLEIPPDVVAGVLRENPWLAPEGDPAAPVLLDPAAFKRFAKLFGVPNRKAHAWFFKHNFWTVRTGITRFQDESGRAEINEDDYIPF